MIMIYFISGATKPSDIEPELMVPIFDKLCCCLPATTRKKLHCGVAYGDHHQQRSEEEQEKYPENALKNGKTTDSLKTKTVEWYKYLLDAQKISNSVILNNRVL